MDFIRKIKKAATQTVESLLPIAEGRIISSNIVENGEVLMELYSYGKGESISSHNLLKPLFVYVLKGNITFGGIPLKEGNGSYLSVGHSAEQVALEDSLALVLTFLHDDGLEKIATDTSIDLAHQIQLLGGSVASVTYRQTPCLSMSAFALDKGEGLSTHAASGDALVIPLEGSVDVTIDSNVNHVKHGEIIVLPAGLPHSLHATSVYKMLLIVVKDGKIS